MTRGDSIPAGSSIRYDETEEPFIVITLPERSTTEAEFVENLRRMNDYASRGGAFGFVIDTRGSSDPDANRRRRIAEFWDDCQQRYGSAFIGAAIVMTSPTGRAIYKAILWLRQGRKPLVPVATPEEGLQQLRRLLPK